MSDEFISEPIQPQVYFYLVHAYPILNVVWGLQNYLLYLTYMKYSRIPQKLRTSVSGTKVSVVGGEKWAKHNPYYNFSKTYADVFLANFVKVKLLRDSTEETLCVG